MTIKALARLKTVAKGKGEDIGYELASFIGDKLKEDGVDQFSLKRWEGVLQHHKLCLAVENVFLLGTGKPCLFVGSDGIVSTIGKSGGNDVDDIAPEKVKAVLAKLEKLGIPTKKQTQVKKVKIGACTVYTSGFDPESHSISLSIEGPL